MTVPIDAAAYDAIERALAALIETEREVLILQGEAILALEAVALGVGGPGVRVLNLVSGPYGEVIGRWLERGGAEVRQLASSFDRALERADVERVLAAEQFDVVSVVHAEAATGAVNPLAEISRLAHAAGALVLVDAVASVGAEPLELDAWDLDLVAIGTQKALSGPNGVCALIAGPRGWDAIERNPSAPRESILSLLDVKHAWIDSGRARLPFYCNDHEMRALQGALAARAEEGIVGCIERHHRARDAARAGVRALGLAPWVAADEQAAAVVTLVAPPDGVAAGRLLSASIAALPRGSSGLLTAAPGPLVDTALRLNHTGDQAALAPVLEAVGALALGLHQLGIPADAGAALGAALDAYACSRIAKTSRVEEPRTV